MGLERLLLLLGLGFLVIDIGAIVDQLRYWRRRPGALVTWRAAPPPFFLLQILIGAALGLLIAFNLLFRVPPAEELFGEGMMFLYYAYAVPVTQRIERGLYGQGIWTDRGFVPYGRIGGVTWREEHDPVLLLASRSSGTAAALRVPGRHYGAVRRILRDLIANGTIRLANSGLGLGQRDDRENL